MYKVIKHFTDMQDGNHPYNVGDTFPRKGLDVSDERISELAGSENRQNRPLIELVEESETEETPKKAPVKRQRKSAEK